jgi:hypothetical protein
MKQGGMDVQRCIEHGPTDLLYHRTFETRQQRSCQAPPRRRAPRPCAVLESLCDTASTGTVVEWGIWVERPFAHVRSCGAVSLGCRPLLGGSWLCRARLGGVGPFIGPESSTRIRQIVLVRGRAGM